MISADWPISFSIPDGALGLAFSRTTFSDREMIMPPVTGSVLS